MSSESKDKNSNDVSRCKIKNHLAYWSYYIFTSILILMIPIHLYYLFRSNVFAWIYLIWIIYDRKICESGARMVPWIRKLSFWAHFADYFPLRLIRTTELPPDRNYIFACHPHGVHAVAANIFFTNGGGQFSRIFPGLTSYMIVLDRLFLLPIYREFLLLLGFCSSSARSIEYLLTMNKNGGGTVAAIIIGGTREMIDANSDRMVLVLLQRRGFLRLALKNGASIVPVISFGENDLYRVISFKHGLFQPIQELFKKIIGMPLMFYFGCCGFFPKKRPVWTVVGPPIHLDEAVISPTKEQIDQLQQRYIESLSKLYDQHKDKYGHSNVELVII